MAQLDETDILDPPNNPVENCNDNTEWNTLESEQTCSQSSHLDFQNSTKFVLGNRSVYDLKPKNKRKWSFAEQPAKKPILLLMHAIIQSHKKTTVRVKIGTITFYCHMNVLQVYSKYFAKYHDQRMVRLPENVVKPFAFYSIYYWLLSSEAVLLRKGIVDIFKAANFLGIPAIIDQCWLYFDNNKLYNEHTAFKLYQEATNFSTKMLQQLMLSRISKFFLTLVASEDFLKMTCEQVVELLQMNNLGVNNEIEILMSCVRWLQHDWPNRHTDLMRLMDCVRFKLLPPIFLRSLQTPASTQIFNAITTSDAVKAKVNKAFLYVAIEIYGKECIRQENDSTNCDLKAPAPRRWIYDWRCPYHHDLSCPKRQFITYEDFLAHLRNLQHSVPEQWRDIQQISNVGPPIDCCGAERNSRLNNSKLSNSVI